MSVDLKVHMDKAMKAAGLPSTKVAELTNQSPDWMFSANTQGGAGGPNSPYSGPGQAPGTFGSLKKITPSGTNPGKPANRN